MMKAILILILATVCVVPVFAETWTVLVYMAADNNLWQNAVQDINDMELSHKPANLNLIVQADMPSNSTYPGGWRRRIVDDNTAAIVSPVLEDLGNIDSGDPQTLKNFINWGFDHYTGPNVQRNMVVIWGHGDNWFKDIDWKWICPDDGSESIISVSEGELKEALTGIPDLDILLFDACSMQSLEVLAEVMDAADYVIGSEELVPATGFPYQTMMPLFAGNNPEEIATQIPQKYLESYEPGGIQNPDGFTNPITCSAIRTSELSAFYPAFRDYFFDGPLYSYPVMLSNRENYWEMNTGYNDVDVGELLDTYSSWGGGIDNLIDVWNSCTLSAGSLNITHQVGSAAIWFPYNKQYFDTWWTHYNALTFARYRWLTVLNRVYGNPSEPPPQPIALAHRMVLSNLIIDMQQPAYPDSLYYYAYPRPSVETELSYSFTPEFGQQTFQAIIPVTKPGWIIFYSVDLWGNVSDSTTVVYEYSEPPLELLIAPNPVRDRSLASARWYLPDDLYGPVGLKLYNLRGQKVLERSFLQESAGEGIWLLSSEQEFHSLGRGIYIIQLKTGKKCLQKKLTIL